jgi:hypothetical protein
MNRQVNVALISLLVLLCLIPFVSAASETFTVPKNGSQTILVNMNQGNYISGDVWVSFGLSDAANATVNLKITGPNGSTVSNLNVTMSWIFSFTASVTGAYAFDFSSLPSFSSKTVTFTYTVSSSEPNNGFGYSSPPPSNILSIVVSISWFFPVVGIIAGVVLYIRRYTHRYNEPADTPYVPPPYIPLQDDAKPEGKANEITNTTNNASVSEEDRKRGVLLSCRNAWLTETEFCYCRSLWHVSDMVEAWVNNLGTLTIKFNNGETHDFRFAPDSAAMNSIVGQYFLKGDAALLEVSEDVKAKSHQWAKVINKLIFSKDTFP